MKPSVASIISATAAQFGVERERILEPDGVGARAKKIARPRQVAMYLARDIVTLPPQHENGRRSPVTFPSLGRIFGRDHTTIIHAVRTIPKLAENDSELREKINRIRDLMALETNDFPPGYQNAERCEDMVGA